MDSNSIVILEDYKSEIDTSFIYIYFWNFDIRKFGNFFLCSLKVHSGYHRGLR